MADEPNPFNTPPKPRRRKREPWGAEPPPGKPKAVLQKINGQDLDDADVILPPGFTDDDIALQFSRAFAPSLRFVATWNKWLLWDGTIWRADDTLRVFDLVRRHCRVISGDALDPKVRAVLGSARTVAAVEKLVRADRRHATTADQWDADPWLLNTPGGVVDLRTSDLMPSRSGWHMTKMTGVAPGELDCPQWFAFLDTVTAGNLDLQNYLQRVAGYCLTGSTREEAMFFAYGVGGNGKGTFLNTLLKIMGDYAMNADSDTFSASGAGRHLTVLARLQGARLVVSNETEEGVDWNEARIKACSGSDKITANFMRQDPFEYFPQFKLFISGNHKPGLKSVDAAIRRRFNLVPFTVTIPDDKKDPKLAERLQPEWPGILRWAIGGCLDWQAGRLRPPSIVSTATEEYFDSEDATSLWMADCCLREGDDGWTKNDQEISGVLFKSWMNWAIRAGEKPGSHKAFGRTMEKQGFTKGTHTEKGTPVLGIRLRPPPVKETKPNDSNTIPDWANQP